MSLPRFQLTPDAIGPLRRGHPWVYQNGLTKTPPCGEPILLVDEKDRVVAFALGDQGDISARVLGKNPDRIPNLLQRRIEMAQRLREKITPPHTDTIRLINAGGDGLPGLIVDRYGEMAVIRLYGHCWEPHLDAIVDGLKGLPWVKTIFRRFGVRRVDGKKGGETLYGPPPPKVLIVREHGLSFLVRPYTGQKTGLFLDQRTHRFLLSQWCQGQRVINLFSYSGGFSVYAAAHGAKRVTSVDIAPQAIEDARENFRLNGLDCNEHDFVCGDAFHFKADAPVDLLICDPPSLSHKRNSDRNASNAYRDLAHHCGKQLPSGGLLAMSSCTARINRTKWERSIEDGLKKTGRWSYLWRSDEPPDHPTTLFHPEGRYLKFSLYHRRQ